MRISLAILIFLIYLMLTGCNSCNRNSRSGERKEQLSENPDSSFILNFILQNTQFAPYQKKIIDFYRKRKFLLAWSKNGEFVPQADMFVNVVEQADDYGVDIDSALASSVRDSMLFLKDAPYPLNNRLLLLQKNIDITLTAGFFLLAPKLLQGIVDPLAEENIQWHIEPKKIRYSQLLDSILYGQTFFNPFASYKNLHPQVNKLKKMLVKYRAIEQNGGWKTIENNGQNLSTGDSGKRVLQLARRLLITNDIAYFDSTSPVLNSDLTEGVKRFQKRHGLNANGIVDSLTLRYLNIPVNDKIKQILVNMERWRWVPGPLAGNYILVNIPAYRLTIYRNSNPVESMKIIVGKTGSNTVIFQGDIKYVVVNPYWNIPESIAVKEILPQIKKDTVYLRKHQIEVGFKWNFNVLNQDTINWGNITSDNFNYTLRQKPGNKNPLGRIKFLFPNQFSIYLHDTPNYRLFSENDRGFSHGCIRVERPMDLADYLLGSDALKKRRQIYDLLISGRNESITLDTPVPVYILYFTVWADRNGIPQFRKDVYEHDRKLEKRLFQPDV